MTYILVVEDEDKMRHLLSMMLERNGYRVDQASDGAAGLEKVKTTPYDMVISDIKMPNMDGIELLKQIKTLDIPCPLVFITAYATVESAVEAMRQGAADYITKPFEMDRITLTVERTLNLSRVMAENTRLKKEICKLSGAGRIVYLSEAMQKIMGLASRVASTDSAVLIEGESGTGKELLARFVHDNSRRSEGRFVPLNCAAISAGLIESELFGYEKGAFTGAEKRMPGKFEYASGGTFFLDEIGELSLDAQAKLLRALQEQKFQRVGGNEEISVNVRVICATNRNLEECVAKGEFRQDLYFRINVFPLDLPPLRERQKDILPLACHFLENLCKGEKIHITEGAGRILKSYRWPGNVRELVNAMERAMILSMDRGAITSETLLFLKPFPPSKMIACDFKLPPEGISLQALHQELVRQSMEACGNNQSAAAKLLGITRAKFRVLIKHLKQQ